MLVSRRDGGLLLVEQNEHGRLCGEICDHWGNERFAAPVRRASARIAAAMHDEGWREADDEPDAAVAEQEQQWLERRAEVIGEEPRSDFENGLWQAYDLLQAFELLSLYACTANLAPAADEPTRPLTDVLKELEATPGPRVIGSVPERPGDDRTDLVLTPTGDDAVTVDPYPLDQDELELVVRARRIPDRRYESGEDLRASLKQAEPARYVCRLTPPLINHIRSPHRGTR